MIAWGFGALTFLLTLLLLRLLLPYLRKRKCEQMILEIGPNWHAVKQGTPTMGGLAFFLAVLLAGAISFWWWSAENPSFPRSPFLLTLTFAIANGLIGLFDDFTKLRHGKNEGLRAWQKYLLQLSVCLVYLATGAHIGLISPTLQFPFFGEFTLPAMLFYPLAVLFVTGFVNSVNLTDGIDGLASAVTLVVSLSFFVLSNMIFARELEIFATLTTGASLGFLCYNRHPAKIFMGDTGSLFFGGLVVGMAFLSGHPIILFFFGIAYLFEALSDILQVACYKLTHRRIFRMAPLHHHLELCGWSENQIVLVFGILTLVGAMLGIWGTRI